MRLLLIAVVSVWLVTFRSAYAAEVEGVNGGVFVDARPDGTSVSFMCNGNRIDGGNIGNSLLSRGKTCQLELGGHAVVGATLTRISGGKLKLGDAFYAEGSTPPTGNGDYVIAYRVSTQVLRLQITAQQSLEPE